MWFSWFTRNQIYHQLPHTCWPTDVCRWNYKLTVIFMTNLGGFWGTLSVTTNDGAHPSLFLSFLLYHNHFGWLIVPSGHMTLKWTLTVNSFLHHIVSSSRQSRVLCVATLYNIWVLKKKSILLSSWFNSITSIPPWNGSSWLEFIRFVT